MLAKFWPLAFGAGGIAVGALLWRMRGEFATKSDMAAMKTELGKYSGRIERMEGDMKHLPTREDIHSLHIDVTKMRGELGEMRAENRGIREIMVRAEAVLTRHEDIIATAAARGKA